MFLIQQSKVELSGNPVMARVKLTKYIDETIPGIIKYLLHSVRPFQNSAITLLKMNPDIR